MENAKKGFTLVEVMIVVLIIGVLLAIAVPNWFRARENSQVRTCVSNLRQIEEAKEQYAMAHNLPGGGSVTSEDLAPDYIRTWPSCPSGGTYDVNAVDAFPTCSFAGKHTLEGTVLGSQAPERVLQTR